VALADKKPGVLPTVSSEHRGPPRASSTIKRLTTGNVETRKSWTLAELQALSTDIRKAAHRLDEFVTWANALAAKHNLFPEEGY
jgi:hypothetical protein